MLAQARVLGQAGAACGRSEAGQRLGQLYLELEEQPASHSGDALEESSNHPAPDDDE